MERLSNNKSPNSRFGIGDKVEAEVVRDGKLIETESANNAVTDRMGLSSNVKMEVFQKKE